jgi:hypothetical protein
VPEQALDKGSRSPGAIDCGDEWNVLSQSEIAEDEQNDDDGSDKPDDIVHNTLLKFDTSLISGATRRSRTNGRSVQRHLALSRERLARLRQLPATNARLARETRESPAHGGRNLRRNPTFSHATGYVCTVAVRMPKESQYDSTRYRAVETVCCLAGDDKCGEHLTKSLQQY